MHTTESGVGGGLTGKCEVRKASFYKQQVKTASGIGSYNLGENSEEQQDIRTVLKCLLTYCFIR